MKVLFLGLNENGDSFLTKTHHSLLNKEISMSIKRKHLIKKGGVFMEII